jgi:hypothetical protein
MKNRLMVVIVDLEKIEPVFSSIFWQRNKISPVLRSFQSPEPVALV